MQRTSTLRFIKDGRMGIKNNNGTIVIPAIYDHITQLRNNLAGVYSYKEQKYAIINYDGQIITEYKYDDVGNLPLGAKEEIIPVMISNKMGLVSKSGLEIVPPKYDEIEIKYFGNDTIHVKLDKKWGVLDKNGNQLLPIKYDRIGYIGKDTFHGIIEQDGKCGIINKDWIIVVPCEYDSIEFFYPNSNYYALLKKGDKESKLSLTNKPLQEITLERRGMGRQQYYDICLNEKWGLSDKNNIIVIPCMYDQRIGWSGRNDGKGEYSNYLGACVNNKWGFINYDNSIVIPFVFDKVGVFGCGVAPVLLDDKWGVIDTNGSFVINPQYEAIQECYDSGYISVKQNGKWGIVNTKGEIIEHCLYDEPFRFQSYGLGLSWEDKNFIKVSHKDKCGLISRSVNRLIFNVQYGDIGLPKKDLASVRKNKDWTSKWALCSCVDGLLTDYIYDSIEVLANGMSKVKKDSLFGIIDRSGTQVIPTLYKSIEYIESSQIYILKNNSKEGVFDFNGEKLVDFIYDKIEPKGDGIFLVWHRLKRFFIKKNGNRLFENIELDILSPDPKFIDGICQVTINEVKCWLDLDGNLLENPYSKEKKRIKDFLKQYDRVISEEHFGKAYYRVLKFGKVGLLNEDYNVVMPCVYDYTNGESIDNNIVVKRDGKYGLFNLKFKKEVIPCSIGYTGFDTRTQEKYGPEIFQTSQHVLAVGYKPDSTVIRKGEEIISGNTEVWDLNYNIICDRYTKIYIHHVKDGLIQVNNNGLYGYVNSYFDEIIPCIYEHISQLNNDLFWAQKDGKVGVIDKSNKVVIPFEYDGYSVWDLQHNPFIFSRDDFYHGLLKMKKGGLWGYINIHNRIVIDFKYIKAGNFNYNGLAEVHPYDGCIEIINKSGKVLKRRYIDTTSDPIIDDDYIRDGLKEAFNGDSDTYWNID